MTIKFSGPVKHGKETFVADYPYAFEDKGAEEYFVACGWAEPTDQKAKHTYEEGSIEIDPDTIHYDTGVPVQLLVKHSGDVDKARAAFHANGGSAGKKALKVDDHVSEGSAN